MSGQARRTQCACRGRTVLPGRRTRPAGRGTSTESRPWRRHRSGGPPAPVGGFHERGRAVRAPVRARTRTRCAGRAVRPAPQGRDSFLRVRRPGRGGHGAGDRGRQVPGRFDHQGVHRRAGHAAGRRGRPGPRRAGGRGAHRTADAGHPLRRGDTAPVAQPQRRAAAGPRLGQPGRRHPPRLPRRLRPDGAHRHVRLLVLLLQRRLHRHRHARRAGRTHGLARGAGELPAGPAGHRTCLHRGHFAASVRLRARGPYRAGPRGAGPPDPPRHRGTGRGARPQRPGPAGLRPAAHRRRGGRAGTAGRRRPGRDAHRGARGRALRARRRLGTGPVAVPCRRRHALDRPRRHRRRHLLPPARRSGGRHRRRADHQRPHRHGPVGEPAGGAAAARPGRGQLLVLRLPRPPGEDPGAARLPGPVRQR